MTVVSELTKPEKVLTYRRWIGLSVICTRSLVCAAPKRKVRETKKKKRKKNKKIKQNGSSFLFVSLIFFFFFPLAAANRDGGVGLELVRHEEGYVKVRLAKRALQRERENGQVR